MTETFKNKILTGAGDGQGYGPDILFFEKNDQGDFLQNAVPVATVKRISACDEKMTLLTLLDDAKIYVLTPFADLRAQLQDGWASSINLLDVTGREAEKYIKDKSVSDIFNRVVSGTRGKNDDFDITFYGAFDCEDAHDNEVQELTISNSELQYFEKTDGYNDVTYIDTDDNGYYIHLPLSVVQQFYTHAKRSMAAELDLKLVTDPEQDFQKEEGLIAKIPKPYDRVSKP